VFAVVSPRPYPEVAEPLVALVVKARGVGAPVAGQELVVGVSPTASGLGFCGNLQRNVTSNESATLRFDAKGLQE